MQTQQPQTVSSESIAVVEAIYSAFQTGNRETILATMHHLVAKDVVVREPDSLPWGGVYKGVDVFAPMAAELASPQSPMDPKGIRIEHMFGKCESDGREHVIAAVAVSWRGPDRTMEMRALEWFTLKEAKVVEIQIFLWDSGGLLDLLNGKVPGGSPVGSAPST